MGVKIKCARGGCHRDADIKLIHTENGRMYCPQCAREINELVDRPVIPFAPMYASGIEVTAVMQNSYTESARRLAQRAATAVDMFMAMIGVSQNNAAGWLLYERELPYPPWGHPTTEYIPCYRGVQLGRIVVTTMNESRAQIVCEEINADQRPNLEGLYE